MQVIYAVPFMLLSILGFLVCVAVPRWRRYKLQVLVAPVAFGFCSIVTAEAVLLTADHFNVGLFARPLSGLLGSVTLFLIYFLPGLVGGWCAVAVINHRASGRTS